MSRSDGLSLNAIGVRFGGLVALDDVSFDVRPGQIVGVIGPNGAGKTTLFNVVCGFVRPNSGDMTWDGARLRAKPHQLAKIGIGRTLQAVGLFGGLTVVENVMAGATPKARAGLGSMIAALPRADRDERRLRDAAMTHLRALGIDQHANELPTPLPFSVQKRVALARALIAEPRLLLLDEPAAGLAAEEIEELAAVVRGLPTRPGRECAVMLVEHHMDLVMEACDHIVVLNFGRVIAQGPPADIKGSAAVTEAYLGAEVTE